MTSFKCIRNSLHMKRLNAYIYIYITQVNLYLTQLLSVQMRYKLRIKVVYIIYILL